MRKFFVGLLTACAFIAPNAIPIMVADVAVAHDEGNESCVTWHEFQHADFNELQGHIHDIFDNDGQFEELWWHTGDVTRSYPSCADNTPRFCVDWWQGQDGTGAFKVYERYVGPCNDPEGDG